MVKPDPAQTLSETLEGLAVELDARAEEELSKAAKARRAMEQEDGDKFMYAHGLLREAASLLRTRAKGESDAD